MTDSEPMIRPRRDEDIDQLVPVLRDVYKRDGYPVEGVDDPQAWLAVSRCLGAWVAELCGKIVGHVALAEPGPGDDAARLWVEKHGDALDDLAVLVRLFVAPDARGHRIGARLTDAASEHAASAGRLAVLDVMLKDVAAIKTYEALGWTRLGEFNHGHSGGATEAARAYVSPMPPADKDGRTVSDTVARA